MIASNENINWGITAPNLGLIGFEFKKQRGQETMIIFHPRQWYNFLLRSIDNFESDLSHEYQIKKSEALLKNFEKGYKELKSMQIKIK